MRYRIKIVPKAAPNAEGEWREVETATPLNTRWLDHVVAFASHVPATHFLCAVEQVQQ